MTIKSRLAKLENSSSISKERAVIVIDTGDDKRLLDPEYLEGVCEEHRKENPGRDIVFIIVNHVEMKSRAEFEDI